MLLRSPRERSHYSICSYNSKSGEDLWKRCL